MTTQNQDPMDFLKNFWGNMGFPLPGMVAPTVDSDELSRRISDLKTVEGWLKTNLSMLQMTIQGLEMQRATLATLQNMSQAASGVADGKVNPFANAALWPWNFLQPGNAAHPGGGSNSPSDANGGAGADAAGHQSNS